MPIDFWLWEIQSIQHAYFNSSDNDNFILTSKSVAKINIGKLMCFITSCSLIASSYTTLSVIRLSSLSQDNRTRVHSQLWSWYSHLSDMQITLGILFIKKILFTRSSWNIRWMNPHKSCFSQEITWEPGQLDLAQEWMMRFFNNCEIKWIDNRSTLSHPFHIKVLFTVKSSFSMLQSLLVYISSFFFHNRPLKYVLVPKE